MSGANVIGAPGRTLTAHPMGCAPDPGRLSPLPEPGGGGARLVGQFQRRAGASPLALPRNRANRSNKGMLPCRPPISLSQNLIGNFESVGEIRH